jgi:RimJ/RimL family protein N-acetyltransferase
MIPYSTARLVLRSPEDSDVEPLMAMDADPEVMRYIRDGAIIPPDRDRARQAVTRWRKQWDDHGFGMCSVIVRETGEYAGSHRSRTGPDRQHPPHRQRAIGARNGQARPAV